MNKLICVVLTLLAVASYLAAEEEQSSTKADQPAVDLNKGIEIEIVRNDAPTKRPLTSLFSSAARGVGRLARNLGTEVGTYAGVLGMGTYDLVKNSAKTGLDALRRTANRIAHPRGGPLYESSNGVAPTTQASAETGSSDLKDAAAAPNELSNNEASTTA